MSSPTPAFRDFGDLDELTIVDGRGKQTRAAWGCVIYESTASGFDQPPGDPHATDLAMDDKDVVVLRPQEHIGSAAIGISGTDPAPGRWYTTCNTELDGAPTHPRHFNVYALGGHPFAGAEFDVLSGIEPWRASHGEPDYIYRGSSGGLLATLDPQPTVVGIIEGGPALHPFRSRTFR